MASSKFIIYKVSRFHFSRATFQSKNITEDITSVTHSAIASYGTFLFIHDLLLSRRTGTRNLFAKLV